MRTNTSATVSLFRSWLGLHIRDIAMIGGSGLVTVWTVIRHISNGVNFDVVGQIGVADQWARGIHGGAQLGATNYLLKMPAYYIVNHIGFLSPHLKLLLLALTFNIVTFILLIVLFEKILRLYNIIPSSWFYLGLIWLASISGRVYWLEYANSRNLETVGGIWILYLGLRLLKLCTWKRWITFVGAAGVIFFADQLQIYVIGGGLLLFAATRLLAGRTYQQFKKSSPTAAGLFGAYIVAKLLLLLATALLPVTFLVAPKGEAVVTLHKLTAVVHGVINSTARVFDASFYATTSTPNELRQLLNCVVLLTLLGGVTCAVYALRAKRDLAVAVLCCMGMGYAAYVASNQVLQPITERYLVMIPLLFILLLGSVSQLTFDSNKIIALFKPALVAILLCCSVLALGALTVSWPDRYSKDAYIPSALHFLQANGFTYAVSSRDAIPETYFSEGTVRVLPAICQPDHKLVLSNLFYDREPFTQLGEQAIVPIMIPNGGIVSSGSTCDVNTIEAQFGRATETIPVPGIGTAKLYSGRQLKIEE